MRIPGPAPYGNYTGTLEREYDQEIVTTVPNVEYRVISTGGEILHIDNPSQMPPPGVLTG